MKPGKMLRYYKLNFTLGREKNELDNAATDVPLWHEATSLLAPGSVHFHFASFHLFEADLKINHSQDNRWLINTTRCTLTLLLVIARNGQNFLRALHQGKETGPKILDQEEL